MGIAVQAMFLRTSDILQDDEFTRWTKAERVRWMNDFPSALLARRPAGLSRTKTVTLVAGTLQSVSDDAVLLLDVVRNMGNTGTSPGLPVRRTDRQQFDDTMPTWHMATPKAVIKHFMFDDRVPKSYYVYPPAIAGTKVETVEAALPTPIDEDDEDAVLDIGYRAHQKDSEYANGAIAGQFYQAFEEALGVKSQQDIGASPNQVGNSV